ncbi:MAG TPA: hypothetical protein VFZ04_17670 [Longimicrobiales bacterium]
MDDLFPLLLFLIFVLGPILEGLKRKNKGGQPPERRPPPRVPQRRLPQQRPPQQARGAETSRTEEISPGPRRQEESAAGMVPDDLWEILTGQKRPPVLTTPQPAPQRETRQSSWDVGYDAELEEDEEGEAEVAAREDVLVETRRARVEAQSLETYERHPEPVIISLEDNLPTTAQRHQAFHQKIAAPPVEQPVEQSMRLRLNLMTRSELQRAFLLQEVLGKPRGLD